MMAKPNDSVTDGARLAVNIPLQDNRLFAGEATDDILLFLTRHRDRSFSVTDISKAVDYTRPTVTKTVDVLSSNDLVSEERDGTRRVIQINRERLTVAADPYLEIPQQEFYPPVKSATEALMNELDDVLAVVLYGSVARGEADRRSDVDLWILVREDRMDNQRRANRVRQDLEQTVFDGDRYGFEIDVEGLQAVPNYADEIRKILNEGIAVYRAEEFETIREMVMYGETNE